MFRVEGFAKEEKEKNKKSGRGGGWRGMARVLYANKFLHNSHRGEREFRRRMEVYYEELERAGGLTIHETSGAVSLKLLTNLIYAYCGVFIMNSKLCTIANKTKQP